MWAAEGAWHPGFLWCGSLFSVLFWGSCDHREQEGLGGFFCFSFFKLAFGCLGGFWGGCLSQLYPLPHCPGTTLICMAKCDSRSSAAAQGSPETGTKMLLPLPKSNPQVSWEKSLMFPICGWTWCQKIGHWQGAGSRGQGLNPA